MAEGENIFEGQSKASSDGMFLKVLKFNMYFGEIGESKKGGKLNLAAKMPKKKFKFFDP